MIPLWLTIICAIILLTVIFYNILTSDIDWETVMAVVFISIAQRLSC